MKKCLCDVQSKLHGKGRAFIRYSGTEMLARVTVEGPDQDEINGYAEELAELLKKELC